MGKVGLRLSDVLLLLLIALGTLIGLASSQEDAGHCIWYGVCKNDNGKGLNCLNNTHALPLVDSEAKRLFKNLCPDLYPGTLADDPLTCCSAQQIKIMSGNMAVPTRALSRCPSCFHNFLNLYCYFTCAPNHSTFVHVNETVAGDVNDTTAISAVNAVFSTDFAYGMFNSCKDVQMPATNDRALSILCGANADQCTAQSWLDYMGSTDNGQTPFTILFNISDTPLTINNSLVFPMNHTTVPCYKALNNDSSACSCQDCHEACTPVPPNPPPPQPWVILYIDGISFVMGALFLVFLVVFGTYSICYNIIVQDSLRLASPEVEDGDTGCCDRYSINGHTRSSGSSGSSRLAKKLERVQNIQREELGRVETWGAQMQLRVEHVFNRWGVFCARRPRLVLLAVAIFAVIMTAGIALFQVTTDPVELWSAPNSRARLEKDYFDKNFAPFFRTEQLIITRTGNHSKVVHSYPAPSVNSIQFNPIFDLDFLHEVLKLQTEIENLEAPYINGTVVTLQDICLQPLYPDYKNCTIQSILQYYQDSKVMLDKVVKDSFGFFVLADYLDHFLYCVRAPASINDTTALHSSCLGAFGGPVFPWVVLGGYDGDNYQNASALVITFVVNNHHNPADNDPALAWESAFIDFMKNYSNPNMTIAFSSERSIEDEIERESSSDIMTILISYLIMFAYISLSLGRVYRCSTILVDSKMTLGLAGVLIVLVSVSSSLGFFSYVGKPATLIIIEVVPFLVLAVGVDNIFILVQSYQRDERRPMETLEEQVGRIVGQVGPSMLLTSLSESIAFFIGAMTTMPAVQIFSLYAAMAVFFDFLFQITCFVSLMTLDAKRQEARRLDCCCCVRQDKADKGESQNGFLYTFVKKYYAHFLLKEWVRPIVMVVFVGWFCASVSMASKVEIGLDQSLSMPVDSYVLDYFQGLKDYLSVGPPVYFVVKKGHNYTNLEGQNEICGGNGCLEDSLLGQVYTAAQSANYTRMAHPATSWLDDYFAWLSPGGQTPCCRYVNNSDPLVFCEAKDTDPRCVPCDVSKFTKGRPAEADFVKYLPGFLQDNPEIKCAKGGHGAYDGAVQLLNNKTEVGATYFMTYHTVLKTSADYIDALRQARKIAANITKAINATEHGYEVYPYSIFYVFYEQYLTIISDTLINLSICLTAIFGVSFVLLGFEFFSALMVVITIIMILADLVGFMYLYNISLNAVSVVNLVMAVGISVEFCSHLTRAFTISTEPTRKLRAKDALAHMGSSVLSGITLTKLGGIVVLAFSKSQLFQVFYFRMYLGIVLFGATHGLIFLPVMLSYVGPGMNKAKVYFSRQEEEKERARHVSTDDPGMGNERQYLVQDSPPIYSALPTH